MAQSTRSMPQAEREMFLVEDETGKATAGGLARAVHMARVAASGEGDKGQRQADMVEASKAVEASKKTAEEEATKRAAAEAEVEQKTQEIVKLENANFAVKAEIKAVREQNERYKQAMVAASQNSKRLRVHILTMLGRLLARGARESSQLLTAETAQRKAKLNASWQQRLAKHSSRTPAPPEVTAPSCPSSESKPLRGYDSEPTDWPTFLDGLTAVAGLLPLHPHLQAQKVPRGCKLRPEALWGQDALHARTAIPPSTVLGFYEGWVGGLRAITI